jgi:hypothetical protein
MIAILFHFESNVVFINAPYLNALILLCCLFAHIVSAEMLFALQGERGRDEAEARSHALAMAEQDMQPAVTTVTLIENARELLFVETSSSSSSSSSSSAQPRLASSTDDRATSVPLGANAALSTFGQRPSGPLAPQFVSGELRVRGIRYIICPNILAPSVFVLLSRI